MDFGGKINMEEENLINKHKKTIDFFKDEGFIPLDNKSFPLLNKYKNSSLFQEKSITAFIAWQYTYFGHYKIINDCLCSVFFHKTQNVYWTIHRPKEDTSYHLQPLIDTLSLLNKKAGIPVLQIKFVEEHLLADYKAVSGYVIETSYNIDSSEYAYKTKDLAAIDGHDNYYKRKRFKKFLERTDISVRPITKQNVKFCIDIENYWCNKQDCSYCLSFFGCEKKAIEVITDIFDENVHHGLFLYENEAPVGFIIAEKTNKYLSFTYFGKSKLPDGFTYLIYIMYKEHINDVEYMNINEDMGHPGLRRFKRLLGAYELWHKYIVTYRII